MFDIQYSKFQPISSIVDFSIDTVDHFGNFHSAFWSFPLAIKIVVAIYHWFYLKGSYGPVNLGWAHFFKRIKLSVRRADFHFHFSLGFTFAF